MDERRFVQPREPQPDGRRPLRIAVRLAFIADAEKDSRRRLERPLTADELRRVVRRFPNYPGD